MSKYKAAKAKGKGKGGGGERKRGAIPCVLFLIAAMALLMLLFYGIMKGALGHAG
jgi:hypothetical protein